MNFIEFLQESKFSDELVGKKLFGDFLDLDEPDTKKETELFTQIHKYIKDEKNRLKPGIIKTLVKLKNDFPEILQAPVGKIAYRGTSIKDEDIIITGKEKLVTKGEQDYYICKAHYNAKNQSQSWSTDFNTAELFGGSMSGVSIILETKITDTDFLFSTVFTNSISIATRDYGEYEVIRISDKPLKCTAYLHPLDYEQLKKK